MMEMSVLKDFVKILMKGRINICYGLKGPQSNIDFGLNHNTSPYDEIEFQDYKA